MEDTDKFHRHEVIDRTSTILAMLEQLLYEHPALDSDLQVHYTVAINALATLYQLAGEKAFKDES